MLRNYDSGFFKKGLKGAFFCGRGGLLLRDCAGVVVQVKWCVKSVKKVCGLYITCFAGMAYAPVLESVGHGRLLRRVARICVDGCRWMSIV